MGKETKVINISQIENVDDCINFAALKPYIDSMPGLAEDLISKSARGRQQQLIVLDLTRNIEDEKEKKYKVLHGQSKLYSYIKLGIQEFPVKTTRTKPPVTKLWRNLFEADYMSLSSYEKGSQLYKLVKNSGMKKIESFTQYGLPKDSCVLFYYAYLYVNEYPEIKITYINNELTADIVRYLRRLFKAAEKNGCRRDFGDVLVAGGDRAARRAISVYRRTGDIKEAIESAKIRISDDLFKELTPEEVRIIKLEMSKFYIPGWFSKDDIAPQVYEGLEMLNAEKGDLDLLRTYLLLHEYCGFDITMQGIRELNAKNNNIARKFMLRFSTYMGRLYEIACCYKKERQDVYALAESPEELFRKDNPKRRKLAKQIVESSVAYKEYVRKDLDSTTHARQVATRYLEKIKVILGKN